MSIEDNIKLLKNNVEEIITENDLINLLEKKNYPLKAYVGYEPSGKIHLGHLMTVNKLLELQKIGFEITVLLADIHAYLNKKGTMDEIKSIAEYNKKCFIALGLDKNKTRFVLGSEYQTSKEYTINLMKIARKITLNRSIRSMDEVGRQMENPMVSQLIYPIMQCLDIAHLDIDVAVGGIDQRKIHMLAREYLEDLGFKKPVCIHIPIVLGLDGKKMSSSNSNFISVDDSKDDIYKKIKKSFCEEGNINKNPVLELFKYYICPRYDTIIIENSESNLIYNNYNDLELSFKKKEIHPKNLKVAANKYLNNILEPVRSILVETNTK